MLQTEKNIKNVCFAGLCFYFDKIHDCFGFKASSTAASQDRVTAKSHQFLISLDLAFGPSHCHCRVYTKGN